LRGIIDANIDRLLPLLAAEDPFAADQLPDGVPTLMKAIALLHRPSTLADAEAGRRRLAWEELFFIQLLHARARRRAGEAAPGIAFERTDTLIAPLYRSLPFELTAAQVRAVAEIFADMTSERRMHRLLQGDVGSGKTIVALFAMLLAAEAGYQSALMAPTEILAAQHARVLAQLAASLPVRVVLLTGSLGAAERREALAQIVSGDASLVVGTHALIQDAVSFHRLGLAVIDEQHRFGVRQRHALTSAGMNTDTLVMSATPIPRSLALTIYGDLDLTVLDELPPTRRPVETHLRGEGSRPDVYEFIRGQVVEGRQACIVYPLIEESEAIDLKDATSGYEALAGRFPDARVALLHGRVAPQE
jgi:ATP-dependent DNA helicase RecG